MKILAFDVESNGLHGAAFAVGGVVYEDGRVADTFIARCPIEGAVNEWVAANVIPQMTDIEETHLIGRTMRDAFWGWLQANKQDAIVVVDVGYPVEARFLLQCQIDDDARAWDAPYPLHDLASILLSLGVDPDVSRVTLLKNAPRIRQHNPVDDALVAAILSYGYLTAVRIAKQEAQS